MNGILLRTIMKLNMPGNMLDILGIEEELHQKYTTFLIRARDSTGKHCHAPIAMHLFIQLNTRDVFRTCDQL